VEGCIKQWFKFVKPNFEKYVDPQRKIADVILPRGIENVVAISESAQSTVCGRSSNMGSHGQAICGDQTP
jgi:uridine kinase